MKPQTKFLRNEFAWLSVQAAFQHASIYSQNIDETKRDQFRTFIENRMNEISKEYYQPISESRHEQNIERLIEETKKWFGDILIDRHIRVGIAQKALNLFLKYLWCAGEISTPPHCPFDSRIIDLLSLQHPIHWTEFDSLEDYRILVTAAREKAGNRTLSEWELEEFQRISDKEKPYILPNTLNDKIVTEPRLTMVHNPPSELPIDKQKAIKLLIVDDIAETRERIRRLVQSEKDIVVVGGARTGVEAVMLCEETCPDVVISNICMPDMDGIGMTFAICHRHPETKVIICSVMNEPDYMRLALYAGAMDFLSKPPSADEMIATIRACGAQKRKEKVIDLQRRMVDEASKKSNISQKIVPNIYKEIVNIIDKSRRQSEEILKYVIRISEGDMEIKEGSRKIELDSKIAIDEIKKANDIFQVVSKKQDSEVNGYRLTSMYQPPSQKRDYYNLESFIRYEATWSLERINRYSQYWKKWGLEVDEYCPLMKISAINAINTLSGFTIENQDA